MIRITMQNGKTIDIELDPKACLLYTSPSLKSSCVVLLCSIFLLYRSVNGNATGAGKIFLQKFPQTLLTNRELCGTIQSTYK